MIIKINDSWLILSENISAISGDCEQNEPQAEWYFRIFVIGDDNPFKIYHANKNACEAMRLDVIEAWSTHNAVLTIVPKIPN